MPSSKIYGIRDVYPSNNPKENIMCHPYIYFPNNNATTEVVEIQCSS
jgi:hypothetical protein